MGGYTEWKFALGGVLYRLFTRIEGNEGDVVFPATVSRIYKKARAGFVLLTIFVFVCAARAQQEPSPMTADVLQSLSNDPIEVYYDYIDDGVLSGGHRVVEFPSASTADMLLLETPSYASYTLIDSGPCENRIDLVCVGDGYTAGQMGLYWQQVQTVINAFFQESPLNRYAAFFNVHVVEVVSNESGVDEVDNGIYRDTALDMAFVNDRQLNVDSSKARLAAGSAPGVDVVIALANSTRYGGSGYSKMCIVSGGNASVRELALHEFGHAFANLADEYHYSDGAVYAGAEATQPNASIYTAAQLTAQKVKWYRWIGQTGIGTFEGAKYKQYGIYRPVSITKMQTLGYPYGPVNSEQFVLKIYAGVSPIDDVIPAPNSTVSAGTVFTVSCQSPVPDTLSVSWQIDGVTVPGATERVFCPADFADYLVPNTRQTLAVCVADQTTLVRDEEQRTSVMSDQRTWQIWTASADLASSGAVGIGELSGMAASWLTNDPVYDVVPDGGDGIVDLRDFSSFAAVWDNLPVLQPDGAVDAYDLMRMAASWLTNDPACDIAPAGGDGTVNMLDLAVLAAQWSK
jgi:hypothetical protein